jgi:hypothetical protein
LRLLTGLSEHGRPLPTKGLAPHARTTAQVQNGTLIVTGTNGADDITLLDQVGNPGVLEVDVNGDFVGDFSFDRSTFTAIDIQARGGDDRVLNRARSSTRSRRSTAAAATTR